jgi:hypothetical protein
VVPLFEWYHPGRRVWSYGTEPDELRSAGYRRVGVVAGLDAEPGPGHVALFRSPIQGGGSRLQLVPGEAPRGRVEQVAAFVLAAWPGAVTAAASTPGPPTMPSIDQVSPVPFPGSWPVFELHRAGHEPRCSADPGPLLAQGWSIGAVVGFVAEPAGPGAQIAWLHAALGLDPSPRPLNADGWSVNLHDAAHLAVGVARRVRARMRRR